MVTNSTLIAGNNYHFGGILNTSGVLVGTSDPTAGDQDGSPMFRMVGAKSTPLQVNEPDTVNQTGDDTTLAQWSFDAAELPDGVLTYAVVDLDQEALFQSTKTFNVAETKFGVRQPRNTVPQDICLIHQSRAKSSDAGTSGAARWAGTLYPLATAIPLGGTREERAPMDNNIKVTINTAEAFPWGQTFQESLQGTIGSPELPFHTVDPVTIHTHKGDAAETVFNLALTPSADAKMAVFIDGLITTDWSRVGKVLTFGTAPASGSYIHTWYEFDTNA